MKKNIGIILALLINIPIAYFITSILGIQNIVLLQSMTTLNYTITYEVIIWFVLILIEYVIYRISKCILQRTKRNDKII